MSPLSITRRPRRLRLSHAVRELVHETRLDPSDFILPLFVKAGGDPELIDSMPDVQRLPIAKIGVAAAAAAELGIPAVALFPVIDPSLKNAEATHACSTENILFPAIREVKRAAPDIVVVADVALDPYTDHGHDGLLDDAGSVDNDRTVGALCRLAVLQADAGADWVAPSDMMDGRVGAIRAALDQNHRTDVSILAYAAKYASAFYGPFREAVGSASAAGTRALDKRTYQLNPANTREALLEVDLDLAEGADAVMVKPAGPYLDIIAKVRERVLSPVAAYQVSGEYAQIHAAARLGWLDLKAARDESLIAIKRAGADMILSYFAMAWAEDWHRGSRA